MVTGRDAATFQSVRVAAVDADLAAALGPELAQMKVAVRRVQPGPWRGAAGGLGTLVVRGLLAHGTRLAGQRSVVLAWSGDVITPATSVPAWMADHMRWEVREPSVLAELDAPLAAAIAARPHALAAVTERISRMTARSLAAVAVSQAPRVEDRLLALLLLISEERGRVTADGVLVPAFLTHERLGELIGAARPTVSLAFSRLREKGLVAQRDGEWLIAHHAVGTLQPERSDVKSTWEGSQAVRAQARHVAERARRLREQARDASPAADGDGD